MPKFAKRDHKGKRKSSKAKRSSRVSRKTPVDVKEEEMLAVIPRYSYRKSFESQ